MPKINDEVWVLKREWKVLPITCPTCEGAGKLLRLNKVEIICPTCKGSKMKYEGGFIYEPFKVEIVRITTTCVVGQAERTIYGLRNGNIVADFGREYFYTTLEEAQLAAIAATQRREE